MFKLNKKQLASLVKYLYDVSKGVLVACFVGSITNPDLIMGISVAFIAAMLLFLAAIKIEGGDDE